MKKHMLIPPVFLVAVVALILGVAIPGVQAQVEFEEAEFNIEFNFTDEDLGVRAFVDGEPWKDLEIEDPDGDTIVDVEAEGGMADQGYAEWMYESGEPTLAEVPILEFLSRFPEGTYEFEGETIEGDDIEGEADFTHDIPCGFDIDADFLANPGSVTITWDTPNRVVNPNTTESGDVRCRGPAPTIEGYEVILEGEERELTFILPEGVNELVIPLALLEADTEYQYEVIAIEESGNQTIVEDDFTTPV